MCYRYTHLLGKGNSWSDFIVVRAFGFNCANKQTDFQLSVNSAAKSFSTMEIKINTTHDCEIKTELT
jgi:hypothetical protein